MLDDDRRMDIVGGAKMLSEVLAQRGAEPSDVEPLPESAAQHALPLFRWTGVEPPPRVERLADPGA